jgi:hypothetical protein
MLTKVGCVSGCRLTVSHADSWKMCNRLPAYTLRCTHGRVYQNHGASTFEEGDVGPSNVVTKFINSLGAISDWCQKKLMLVLFK